MSPSSKISSRRRRQLRREAEMQIIGTNEEGVDLFDQLPEPLLLLIFTAVADVETLIRCRAVSKRFNLVVPQVDSLVLRLDRLGSTGLVRSVLLKSLRHLGVSKRSQSSPAQILRGFERVKELLIRPPAEDLNAAVDGELVRWKAYFGDEMAGCVVVGMRSVSLKPVGRVTAESESDRSRNLNMGGKWITNALRSAVDCHAMATEVIRDHNELKFLEARDEEGKGCMVMTSMRLPEWKEGHAGAGHCTGHCTICPPVRTTMWYQKKVKLADGTNVEGAMVVVARPIDAVHEEVRMATDAFTGMYGEVAHRLVKGKDPYFVVLNRSS